MSNNNDKGVIKDEVGKHDGIYLQVYLTIK